MSAHVARGRHHHRVLHLHRVGQGGPEYPIVEGLTSRDTGHGGDVDDRRTEVRRQTYRCRQGVDVADALSSADFTESAAGLPDTENRASGATPH